MTNQELFESIQEKHSEKKILSLTKKLIRKCSFNSGEDAGNLCSLSYWLFIYGYKDEALLVCQITHDAPFPGKAIWNVWDFIIFMWGLEVYLLKEKNENEEASALISRMDKLMFTPSPANAPETSEDDVKQREMERRNRFTISSCSFEDKISACSSKSMANDYRLSALFRLIGYGATGLFPNLDIYRPDVKALANSYISELQKTR